MLRFHLKPFLERHQITAYQLARATKGQLSESTVYGMSRAPLQRIDLDSVRVVMNALEEMIGAHVQLEDLMTELPEPTQIIHPRLAELLKHAKPATAEQLQRVWTEWTPEELAADDQYWLERDGEKQLMSSRYLERSQAEVPE